MIQSIIGTSFTGGYNQPLPFDITANWSLTTPVVVDAASFKEFLESGEDGDGDTNNLTDVVITDFSLVGNQLTCNLSATGVYFYLAYMEISLINGIGNILGIKELRINNNQIVTFDPTQALPNSLELISIPNNQIVTFNPSIPLPNSLITLSLANNQIVTFDPSIALPNSLVNLNLNNNQMTTAGYTASESWANSMSVIPNRGTIDFNNNINGVIGTNLESILVSKGWTVEGDTAQLPFDVTANWSLTTPPVTDEASFITFLESGQDGDGNTNSQTGVVITDFLLEGDRLRCNVSSTGGSDLAFSLMGITDATSFGNLQMTGFLYLYSAETSNNILSVDNTSWPIGVTSIDVSNNSITSFDNVTWPSGLQNLYLNSNQIVTFDPTIALPNGLQQLGLSNNQIVTFDPSIALPSSLQNLYLEGNQMTTAGYTASESWANSMSLIPNRGTIDFNNNINGVIGTNLESILVSKGWTVQGNVDLPPFRLMFTDISFANTLVGDATNVNDWNTYLDLPILGTPFTSVNVSGDEVSLYGGAGITLKTEAFTINLKNDEVPYLVSVDDESGVIVELQDSAFSSQSLLTTVSLPQVVTIDDECFNNCDNLAIINLPQLTTAGSGCFAGCSLTTVTLPLCTNLGGGVFNDNVFWDIIGNTISLTIPAALMTCNAGNPDGDIQYLQANNTVTITQV